MALAVPRTGIVDRMVRAARLDNALYNEVEADTTATQQALLVIVIVSVCGGIGAAIGAAQTSGAGAAIGGMIGRVLVQLVQWAISAFVIYLVGTRLFKGTATWGELLRTLGFASAPGVLLIFGFIPFVGGLIGLIVLVWTLITNFVAVREALDFDNGNTLATIVVAWLVTLVIVFLVLTPILVAFGLGAAAMRLT